MPTAVSIVTVSYDTLFFIRLLVEKVRELVGCRSYEIIVVDRQSRDGTREWLSRQPDVRVITIKPNRRGHGHGEAAELGAEEARYDHVVLLDSDAHPIAPSWLELTADRLDAYNRLAGAIFHGGHKSNPQGWYIHPHFMVFHKKDLGQYITLRKVRGEDFDTAEAATVRLMSEGLGVIGYPLQFCNRFDVGHPCFPTVAAGVFHAWYGTRIPKELGTVRKETAGAVDAATYIEPLKKRLREAYRLDY